MIETVIALLMQVYAGGAEPEGGSAWEFLAVSSTDSIVSVRAPIQVPPSGSKVWVKFDHSKDSTIKARSSVELWKFNCTEQSMLALSRVRYDAKGKVSHAENTGDNSFLYQPVIPESIGEAVMKHGCRPS